MPWALGQIACLAPTMIYIGEGFRRQNNRRLTLRHAANSSDGEKLLCPKQRPLPASIERIALSSSERSAFSLSTCEEQFAAELL